jgi:hypothetical protein
MEQPISEQDSCTKYECKQCSFVCFTAKSFTEHSMQLHKQKPFACADCGMRYKHKYSLEDHVKAKHSSQEPTIPCDKCGKKFYTKAYLFVHRREQHILGDSRKVKCDICNLWYKGQRNLSKHKETHREESHKKFQCLYCSKTFRTRNSLNVHERVHTGETPYKCHLCVKHFKRSHHLYSHLKCADHLSKLSQLESEGKEAPDPIFSVTKSIPFHATSKDFESASLPEPIYMEVTEVDGSNTVQVVVPGDIALGSHHPGGMTTDQLLQSAVLLASTEDYQNFVSN